MSRPHLLLIENDPLTLTLLERVLVSEGYAVTSSSSFSPTLDSALDVPLLAGAVLDLDLGPGPNGIDIGLYLRSKSPNLPIVILTSYVDLTPFLGGRALPQDFSYLNKSQIAQLTTFEVLIKNALRGVVPKNAKRAEVSVSGSALKVWAAIARGLTNEEISKELEVGVKAIEKTISKLLIELGISSTEGNPRVKLVRRYYELNGQLPR